MNKFKISKKFTKNDWGKLLKRDLIRDPSNHKQYIVPDYIQMTIATKKGRQRYFHFGGPIYCSYINFPDTESLEINFITPSKKPNIIKWANIESLTTRYFSA